MCTRSGRKFAASGTNGSTEYDILSDDENESQRKEDLTIATKGFYAGIPKLDQVKSRRSILTPKSENISSPKRKRAEKQPTSRKRRSRSSSNAGGGLGSANNYGLRSSRSRSSASKDGTIERKVWSQTFAGSGSSGSHLESSSQCIQTPVTSRKFFKASESRSRTGLIQKCDSRHGFVLQFGKSEEMPLMKRQKHDENTPKQKTRQGILKKSSILSTNDSGIEHDISQDIDDIVVSPSPPKKSDSNHREAQTSKLPPKTAVDDNGNTNQNDSGGNMSSDSITPEKTAKKVRFYPLFEKKARDSSAPKTSQPKKLVRRRLPFMKAEDQYAIDMGQKDFDASRCNVCKMLYTVGEMSDENHHNQYHDLFVNNSKFHGWKQERVLRYMDDGSRIIAVRPSDPKFMLKKIDDLFSVADIDLNINVNVASSIKDSSLYLIYITLTNRVAGFVAGEGITCASPVLSGENYMVSTETVPAAVGVTRVWVHPNFRRQKVATSLLDVLRANYLKDEIIKRSKVAFSDTTDVGRLFAQEYTGTENFLVYQYEPNIQLYR